MLIVLHKPLLQSVSFMYPHTYTIEMDALMTQFDYGYWRDDALAGCPDACILMKIELEIEFCSRSSIM